MLKHPTLDQLPHPRPLWMAKAFADLAADDQDLATPVGSPAFLDQGGLVGGGTNASRPSLRAAKLRQRAGIEDVDYRAARGLDRALFQKLSGGRMDRRTTI